MRFYWLVLGLLALWRLTHLIQAEDGPWDLVVRLRRRAGEGVLGRLLDCFYCLSLWLAAPLAYALGQSLAEQLLLWPALSGGAMLLERLSAPRDGGVPVPYLEDPEDPHGLLRPAEGGAPAHGLPSAEHGAHRA